MSMATTKRTATTGRPSQPKKSTAKGRKKSKLTIAGEEASRLARRTMLQATLSACGWNLSKAAELLDMTSASDVIRAIGELGLDDELLAARERGDVARGRRWFI